MVAGCFGIVHDQITYSISPEYFTRMKFEQFRAADFGLPPRIFVAEIGFLATWWVGMLAAWFLARVALRKFRFPGKEVMKALAMIVVMTIATGACGYLLGPSMLVGREGWQDALLDMGVTDTRAFHQVAGIHLGSYAGALLGWIMMMLIFLKRR